MGEELRHGRGDGRDAGRDGHGDGQDVVNHEGRGGDEPRHFSQVRAGDGVGAAALGVLEDDLRVGDGEDGQEADDQGADRQRHGHGEGAGQH